MRREKSIFSISFKNLIGKRHYNGDHNYTGQRVIDLEQELFKSNLQVKELKYANQALRRLEGPPLISNNISSLFFSISAVCIFCFSVFKICGLVEESYSKNSSLIFSEDEKKSHRQNIKEFQEYFPLLP